MKLDGKKEQQKPQQHEQYLFEVHIHDQAHTFVERESEKEGEREKTDLLNKEDQKRKKLNE